MKRLVVVVGCAALAAALGGAWWVTRSGTEPSSAPAVEDHRGEAARPGLAVAPPRGAARVEKAARAPGSIVGRVWRDDVLTAAHVEALAYRGTNDRSDDAVADWREHSDEIDLASFAPLPVATAEADAEGRFEFPQVPAGFYDIVARCEKGCAGEIRAVVEPGAAANVEINVWGQPAEESLRGRVLHGDGTPVAGAAILVGRASGQEGAWPERSEVPKRRAVTSADGRFAVAGLHKGFAEVTAIVDGRWRAESSKVAVPFDGEFVFRIDDPAAAVSGRVVSDGDGAPVAGANVGTPLWRSEFSADESLSQYYARTGSDGSGAFSLALPRGDAVLYATARGFIAGKLDLTADAPRSQVEIRLVRSATVFGTVTTADGRPAAGAKVRVGGGSETVADAEGRYRISDLPPGHVVVGVVGGGWMQDGSRDVPIPKATLEPGASVEIALRAVRPARVEGVVVDAAGRPIPSAAVDEEPTAGIDSDRQPYADQSKRSLPVGPDGTFAFDDMVPGATYAFRATADGFAGGASETVVASPGATTQVRIVLKRARWLVVTVLDAATGAPIEGASATASAKGSWEGFFNADADRDGTARLGPFPEGERLEIEASASAPDYIAFDDEDDDRPDSESRASRVEGADRPGPLAKEIRLTRGLAVEGRLVMPQGPVPDSMQVCLGVRAEGRGEGLYYRRGLRDITVHRDEPDGPYSFRFRGLRPGNYRLWAPPETSERRLEGSMHVAAGSVGVELRVVASDPILTVHVVDEGGKPVDHGDAQLIDPSSRGESIVSVYIWEGGRALFWPNDVPSVTGLVVEATGGSGGVRDGPESELGFGRLGPLAAGTKDATLRLGPPKPGKAGMRIEGRVVATDGRGVGGVLLQAESMHAEGDSDYEVIGAHKGTQPDGSFSIGGLGDGEYRVRCNSTPEDLLPGEAVTARGGAKDVRLVLLPAVSARITVLDVAGVPVAGAEVGGLAEEEGPGLSNEKTDASGTAKLARIDPKRRWLLEVKPPEGRDDLAPFEEKHWEPRDQTVRLARGLEVTGRVVDAAGRPLVGVGVDVFARGRSARSDEDGAFRISSLPAGAVRLTASYPEDDDEDDEPPLAETVVAAGSRDVRLVAASRPSLVVHVPGMPPGARLDRMQLFDRPPGRGWPRHRSPRVSGGVATFAGLRVGVSYTLWWPVPRLGLVAFLADVKAGGAIDVPLLPSKTISGTVRLPPGADEARVVVRLGHAEAEAWTAEDGWFEIEGLPEGGHTVEASSAAGDSPRWHSVEYAGSVQATAGSGTEIVIPLKRR